MGEVTKKCKGGYQITKNKFNNVKHLVTKQSRRFVKCYTWSVLLQGCEPWIISKHAKETRSTRNAPIEVLQRMGTRRELMEAIRKKTVTICNSCHERTANRKYLPNREV